MRPIDPRMIGAAVLLAAAAAAAGMAAPQTPTFRSGVRTVAVDIAPVYTSSSATTDGYTACGNSREIGTLRGRLLRIR
jgi:hypothetical protein